MKKRLRIILLINILLLYCFAITIGSGNGNHQTISKETSSETEYFYTVTSTNLFSHTINTESSVSVYPPCSIKVSFNQLFAFTKATEQIFFNVFTKYNFYSKNVLVRFAPADIVFPFHYFW